MNRRAGLAAGLALGLALGGWAAWRHLARRPVVAPPDGALADGQAGPGGPVRQPTSTDLLASKYNAVLQVRTNDAQGTPQAVGTMLPRHCTLVFTDATGRQYAEQFDRVGLWAIEIPPGPYRIPVDQPGLGEWHWKLSGDGLRRAGPGGWVITIEKEKMNPTVDLLLY